MILTTAEPGAHVATYEQIRDVRDIPGYLFTVPQWVDDAGQPYVVELCAPTFDESSAIYRASYDALGKEDLDKFIVETIFYCMRRPRLTRSQIEVLHGKHVDAVESIAETAWSLADLQAEKLEAEVRRILGLPALTPAPAPPSPRSTSNTTREGPMAGTVDGSTGEEVSHPRKRARKTPKPAGSPTRDSGAVGGRAQRRGAQPQDDESQRTDGV